MANKYARLVGTEEDKINCPFFYKIGACRHGDNCTRNHIRPHLAQTLLIPHLYIPPPPTDDGKPANEDEHFEEFYEEILDELLKFGELEEFAVVENMGDHMFGNLYIKFKEEESADACLKTMTGRYYAGRPVAPEFSPVSDFREARCRQYDENSCDRGGYCNFMHLKHVPRQLRRKMASRKSRDRGRDRDRDRDRDRARSRATEDNDRTFIRSSSTERRAKIAQWNKEREEAEGNDDTSNGVNNQESEPTQSVDA